MNSITSADRRKMLDFRIHNKWTVHSSGWEQFIWASRIQQTFHRYFKHSQRPPRSLTPDATQMNVFLSWTDCLILSRRFSCQTGNEEESIRMVWTMNWKGREKSGCSLFPNVLPEISWRGWVKAQKLHGFPTSRQIIELGISWIWKNDNDQSTATIDVQGWSEII
jgi:hypothetical protein